MFSARPVKAVFIAFGFFCFLWDKDDCKPHPCVNNASCVDGVNNYTCACHPGFEGRNCAISKFLILWEKKFFGMLLVEKKNVCLDRFR